MCGFTGYFNSSGQPASIDIVRNMADKIRHRGPDGDGYWVNDNIALAHRRLSIIDVRDIAGQPMKSPDGRYVMVFNGEIYNFQDIKKDLITKGCRFKTEGDSEVLLSAFTEWGNDAFLKLNGMFAVAIFDQKLNQITLARDRFGVKPLYYQFRNGIFAFGSEAKALFAHPDFSPKLNSQGLEEYLQFMNFITDQTLFDGVKLFPAGSIATLHVNDIRPDGSTLKTTQFWDFNFTGNTPDFDSEAIADDLHDLFTQAVRRQMISDVGVSSFLSGGVDSGSITAIAASETNLLRTFTAGFDTPQGASDSHFDERDAAELMAREFRTAHYEVFIKANDFERVVEDLCFYLDEPRVGQSYPNYIVSELASKFEKVVLSGCGGDELFGGYPWRYFQGIPAKNFDDYIDNYYSYWRRLVKTDGEMDVALAPIRGSVTGFDGRAAFKAIYPKEAYSAKSTEDLLNWSLYFEAKTFMNGLLVVEDKVAMAHSLETRVPFLDNDLVDYACKVPIQAKIGGIEEQIQANLKREPGNTYVESRSDGKAILREMMARLVPEEVYNRKKMGFSAPDASWFRDESAGFIEGKLLDKSRRINDVINPDYIKKTLSDHKNRETNNRLHIWSLIHLAEQMDIHGL